MARQESAAKAGLFAAIVVLSDFLCVRRFPSLVDEALAEDDGELRSRLEPCCRRLETAAARIGAGE